ncbi:hypothetical protein DICVIV_00162 [Dictyocaulus viviparus]|uniref:Uncharacterized protein n=1 Tax=Dictyocaulus viviparus TaxID=29172 RepID=A0A0D8YA93_DICVI|nr:hypothetical protein DICVIV_00162 [Dictyocaulus viviparus]
MIQLSSLFLTFRVPLSNFLRTPLAFCFQAENVGCVEERFVACKVTNDDEQKRGESFAWIQKYLTSIRQVTSLVTSNLFMCSTTAPIAALATSLKRHANDHRHASLTAHNPALQTIKTKRKSYMEQMIMCTKQSNSYQPRSMSIMNKNDSVCTWQNEERTMKEM